MGSAVKCNWLFQKGADLTSESVEGTSLPLEGIDDIHGGDSLPLGVFGVGDGITDDVLKEDLEDTTGLLVDQARDTLDTTTTRQTANSGLGDSLDVITQDFAMTLSASLSKSFSSFTTSSHVEFSFGHYFFVLFFDYFVNNL
jgi:hypothetical protein